MDKRDSLASWREEIGRHLLKLDFRMFGDGPFRAQVRPIFQSGEARVSRVSMSPGETFRDDELAREGAPTYALIVAGRNTVRVCHDRRDFVLPAGHATLLRNWEAGTMASTRDLDYSAVVLAASGFQALGTDAGAGVASRFTSANELLRLIKAYVRLLAESRTAYGAQPAAAIERHLTDLVGLLVSNRKGGPGEGSLQQVRLAAALACIERNYADPTLTAGTVAADLGISVRYLEHLLEAGGQSYSARVRELRLQRARALLEASRSGSRRIIDIAMEAGFSDLSHFNRWYRQRFGETPSMTRGDGVSR